MRQGILLEAQALKVLGRIIAGELVEDINEPEAYMNVTVKIPKGLGHITMGEHLIVIQPPELSVVPNCNYGKDDPIVYCSSCRKMFRCDAMDATCSFCHERTISQVHSL
jgi:hypothetical protein